MGCDVKIALVGESTDTLKKLKTAVCEKYNSDICVTVVEDNQPCDNAPELWNRYNAVIIVAKSESVDNDILEKWTGHPHLRCITKRSFFLIKRLAFKEIDCIVNNIELEKKLLIEMPDISQLSHYKPFKSEIEQIYLLCPNGSHRIRKRGANGTYTYFETLKLRINGSKCIEYENIISAEKYKELSALANPAKHPIVKDRYCFLYKGQYFELDVFDFWNDKAFLELELNSEKQAFKLPPEIKVIKDVSNKKKYKNNHLAGITDYENY